MTTQVTEQPNRIPPNNNKKQKQKQTNKQKTKRWRRDSKHNTGTFRIPIIYYINHDHICVAFNR